MNKFLIVLDIDETIIHSSEYKLDRNEDFFYMSSYDFDAEELFVYKRPYINKLREFIENNDNVEYGFFSNSLYHYCNKMSSIFSSTMRKKPLFVYDRSKVIHRTKNEGIYSNSSLYETIKDLKKVFNKTGYTKFNTIAIDDSFVYPRQRGNFIKINEYNGNDEDNTMNILCEDLQTLASHYDGEDIRQQIKRKIYNA